MLALGPQRSLVRIASASGLVAAGDDPG